MLDSSSLLIFYLFKFFVPGSPNDKDNLLKRVLNPNVCTNPQSAQIELMRWRMDARRLRALGCMPFWFNGLLQSLGEHLQQRL